MKAFPTEHAIAGTMDFKADGMDLRDYFAAKAMQSLIALCHKKFDVAKDKELIVQDAYEIADAMMKERNDC